MREHLLSMSTDGATNAQVYIVCGAFASVAVTLGRQIINDWLVPIWEMITKQK